MSNLVSTARISILELQEIFDASLPEQQLAAFINAASLLVTEELADSDLSSDRLKQIELYLSAHFASLRDVRAESENYAGEYSYKIQGKTGMNLDATFYGQTAKLLDSTGILDKLADNPRKATLWVLGDVT